MSATPNYLKSFSSENDVQARVEIFALCEHATDENGRLTLVRTFEVVTASVFPVTLSDVTVALRIRFWPSEVGSHRFALHFIDPDGVPTIEPVTDDFEIRPADEDRSGGYNLIVKFRELYCAAQGEHSFDLYLDGALVACLPLCIKARD